MKRLLFLSAFATFLLTAIVTPSLAQSKKDSAKIAMLIELMANQDYTFKAQSMTPMSGRLRQITSDYDLRVAKDIIESHLPYIGRAYSATIGGDAGIQFTSKDFEYISKDKKKGGWDITIKLNDTKDVKQMQLSIFDNGTATLQVTSNNRQPISFNGYITTSAKSK